MLLEPAELVGVAAAVEAAQRGEPPPPEAVGAAYKVFTQLPPESKTSVVSMLPPETQSIATAFVNAPPLESVLQHLKKGTQCWSLKKGSNPMRKM